MIGRCEWTIKVRILQYFEVCKCVTVPEYPPEEIHAVVVVVSAVEEV